MLRKLVTSILSFPHNVFKRLLPQGCCASGLCGKELKTLWEKCFPTKFSMLQTWSPSAEPHIICRPQMPSIWSILEFCCLVQSYPTISSKAYILGFNKMDLIIPPQNWNQPTIFLLINAPGAMQNMDREPFFFCAQFAKERVCPTMYFFVF